VLCQRELNSVLLSNRRLKAVYGDDAVDRSTVNRWVIKFRGCEPKKAIIVDCN
jgi:hypothetical protein